MLVNTIGEKFEGFTKTEVEIYLNAMKAVSRIDNPTERDFKKMARENFIPDCLVTPKDVTNARLVFGPNLSETNGKQ